MQYYHRRRGSFLLQYGSRSHLLMFDIKLAAAHRVPRSQ